MKPGFLYYRQIIIAMVLAALIAGCQTDAGEKPGSITPDGIPATTPTVATAVPVLPSPDSTANAIQNDVAPSGWNLEPITAANVQRLSLLARFAEGGLDDEMALSTDGRLLAIATAGGVVLYEAAGGEWVDFYPASSGVTGLAFSPDSQQLAYIFRVPSGEKYSATDPDFAGQEILKPLLTVRSISKGEILYSLPVFGQGCGEYNAWDLTFSPDGKRILFHDHSGQTGFSGSGSLCVLDAESGGLLRAIEPEKPWRVTGFTPPLSDGKTVWAVCVDDSKAVEAGIVLQQLRRYNLESGALETQLDLPETGLLRLSPDQQWMMMGEKVAQIRSAVDGSLAVEINVEIKSAEDNNQFSAAVFSPDGGTLALGAWDGSVSLYSVPQGQPLDRLEPITVSTILAKVEPLHVVNLRFSADGSILYILLNSYFVDTPEVLRAVRLADGQELFRLSGRNTVERRPSLSPDHALLAWGGYEDGSVQVWSTASGKMIY
ncbi:MAG: WD40 repeat domain-containing protein, partial [Chloroflexi bacterium]|nr:WD40 repeat domain-containing protein [Chloroflexota bacterium]